MLYYAEVEFTNAHGWVESRSFNRASAVEFDGETLIIRDPLKSQIFLVKASRLIHFETGTLESRASDLDRENLDADIRRLCNDERRIPAIKLVREVLGLGLKAAKDYVDTKSPRVYDDNDGIPF
jgi:hypothetical protein